MCLSEVKSWQKKHLTDDYFAVDERSANKLHGSMYSGKKGTKLIEIKPVKFGRNKQEIVLEKLEICFETPI